MHLLVGVLDCRIRVYEVTDVSKHLPLLCHCLTVRWIVGDVTRYVVIVACSVELVTFECQWDARLTNADEPNWCTFGLVV